MSPCGKVLASTSDGVIRLWDAATGAMLQLLEGYRDVSYCCLSLAFSPDGRSLFSACENGYSDTLSVVDGMIQLWDVATGVVVQRFTIGPFRHGKIAFSPDVTLIAAVSVNGTIEL